jgi:hypothetical protein
MDAEEGKNALIVSASPSLFCVFFFRQKLLRRKERRKKNSAKSTEAGSLGPSRGPIHEDFTAATKLPKKTRQPLKRFS